MTRQVDDVLLFNGERYALRGAPLEEYFEQCGKRPNFPSLGTRCWRGYRATWAIRDGKLLLVSLGTGFIEHAVGEGCFVLESFFDERLAEVFPDAQAPVPATWVTRDLYVETATKEGQIAKTIVIEAGRIVSIDECPVYDPWAERRARFAKNAEGIA